MRDMALLWVVFAAVGCVESTSRDPDGGRRDAGADADRADAGPDADRTRPDAAPDGDGADSGPDGDGSDSGPDADRTRPDAEPADGDARPVCAPIAEVRALRGPVEVALCEVTVTLVHDRGFFVQARREGPAVHVPAAARPDVRAGDVVTIPVREVDLLAGNVQIAEHGPVEVLSRGVNVAALRQDLSVATPPGEALESELVRLVDVYHDGIDGPYATFNVGYAGLVDVPFCAGAYANECTDRPDVDLCMTGTFGVDAVIMEYVEDGGGNGYRIHAFDETDFFDIRCLETCWDMEDNDGDGLVDCSDPDCAAQPSCQ